MSLVIASSQMLTTAQILARLRQSAGQGSGLYADIVTRPIPNTASSYGGYPQATTAVAMPLADPSATLARYLQGY